MGQKLSETEQQMPDRTTKRCQGSFQHTIHLSLVVPFNQLKSKTAQLFVFLMALAT